MTGIWGTTTRFSSLTLLSNIACSGRAAPAKIVFAGTAGGSASCSCRCCCDKSQIHESSSFKYHGYQWIIFVFVAKPRLWAAKKLQFRHQNNKKSPEPSLSFKPKLNPSVASWKSLNKLIIVSIHQFYGLLFWFFTIFFETFLTRMLQTNSRQFANIYRWILAKENQVVF